MRLPSNPSVLAQVKVMLSKVPLGTSLTLHDLMRAFPAHDQSALSAALSTLANNRYMEIENQKVFSVFHDKSGHQLASNLKSYKLVEYPETELKTKPVFQIPRKNGSDHAPIPSKDVPVKSGERFDRVFACNPNIKFDVDSLQALGKELIYISDFPVHDSITGDQGRSRYEWTISHRLKNFNPNRDVLAIFGDTMVLAMAVLCLASRNVKKMKIARFSVKNNEYTVRELSVDNFSI